jgi:hypothetical protein
MASAQPRCKPGALFKNTRGAIQVHGKCITRSSWYSAGSTPVHFKYTTSNAKYKLGTRWFQNECILGTWKVHDGAIHVQDGVTLSTPQVRERCKLGIQGFQNKCSASTLYDHRRLKTRTYKVSNSCILRPKLTSACNMTTYFALT